MPSASVTCPGWPASCDGAWGASPSTTRRRRRPTTVRATTRRRRRSIARRRPKPPRSPRRPAASAASRRSIFGTASRDFPTASSRPDRSLPAPRGARTAIAPSPPAGPQDVGHWSAPDVQPMALFALPGSGAVRRAQSFRCLQPNSPGPRARAARSAASRLSKLRQRSRGLWFDARVGWAAPPQVPVLSSRGVLSLLVMELIMNKGTVLALLLVVLGGGYGLGRLATRDKDGSNSPAAAAAMPTAQGPSDGVDRVRVPLEGPMKGPAERQGHHRRVLRLPVPVLQPRRPDARARS